MCSIPVVLRYHEAIAVHFFARPCGSGYCLFNDKRSTLYSNIFFVLVILIAPGLELAIFLVLASCKAAVLWYGWLRIVCEMATYSI